MAPGREGASTSTNSAYPVTICPATMRPATPGSRNMSGAWLARENAVCFAHSFCVHHNKCQLEGREEGACLCFGSTFRPKPGWLECLQKLQDNIMLNNKLSQLSSG